MATSLPHGRITSDSWKDLGTPPQARPIPSTGDARPAPAAEAAVGDDVVDPHTIVGPGRRRGGIVGVWDTVAYHAQLIALLVWGPAEGPRASDSVERLRRKYGRPPRKH